MHNYSPHLLSTYTKSKILIISLIAFFLSSPAIAGWEVQWIDTFDGDSVDWDNWTAQTAANYNNEVQCYTDDDSSDEKNYDVSDGTLKIIARKQEDTYTCEGLNDSTSKTWTSGRLNSKDKAEFLYGRVESRIRFSPDDDLLGGTWPAFWMLENRINEQPVAGDDDDVDWPSAGAGEIDVWEWFSNSPDSYITNFFNDESCGGQVNYTYPNGSVDVQDWHKYAMEWAEDEISFYIDDTLVATQDVTDCAQYEESMFVLLNVAMGGNLGGTIDSDLETATMEIDYVAHCYTSDDSDAEYCNEDAPINESQSIDITMSQDDSGIVTLTALVSNVDDDYTLSWDIDDLPDVSYGTNTISFDSTSMDSGSYTVSVELTSDSDSTLSLTDDYTFTVSTEGGSASGGSLNYLFLTFIAFIYLIRRKKSY